MVLLHLWGHMQWSDRVHFDFQSWYLTFSFCHDSFTSNTSPLRQLISLIMSQLWVYILQHPESRYYNHSNCFHRMCVYQWATPIKTLWLVSQMCPQKTQVSIICVDHIITQQWDAQWIMCGFRSFLASGFSGSSETFHPADSYTHWHHITLLQWLMALFHLISQILSIWWLSLWSWSSMEHHLG